MDRYVRDEELIAEAIKGARRVAREASRPTGTEKARTTEVALEAWDQSEYAKELAEQLEGELGPLPGQVQDALDEAAAALSEAGLARSDAAGAVSDAQAAVAEAAQAISDAAAAAGVAASAQSAADDAQAVAGSAQTVADQAAADALAAAGAASAAQSAASSAAAAAEAAQTTADGKAAVVRSTSAATAAGSYKLGDQWWQFSGANVTGFWLHDGTQWVAQALTNAIIATLDAAKITTGFLAAARIQAATITGTHIAGTTITAANMVAGTITAASGIIANAAIGSAQIIDLAVSSAKIADLAVTNAKIADATIQNAKIANLDAAKITTGELDAARIAALSISTGKLAASAVTVEKLAALAVTAEKIAANAVTAVKIAANAVTAEKINAGAVTTDKLNALAVTSEKIAAGAIIADKIAANAITTAKLAATAIDGMTITGALIRTAATGQRMEFGIWGLRSYDASNAMTAELRSMGGGLDLSGTLTVSDGTSNDRTLMQRSGVQVHAGDQIGGYFERSGGLSPEDVAVGTRVPAPAGGGIWGGYGGEIRSSTTNAKVSIQASPPRATGAPDDYSEATLLVDDNKAQLYLTENGTSEQLYVRPGEIVRNGIGPLKILNSTVNAGSPLQLAASGSNHIEMLSPVSFQGDQPGIVRSYSGTDAFTPAPGFSVQWAEAEVLGNSVALTMRVTRIAGAPLSNGTVIGVLKDVALPDVTSILGGTTFIQAASSVGLNLNIATDGTCTLNGGSIPGASTIVFGGIYKKKVV